jgi:hypothetical protein
MGRVAELKFILLKSITSLLNFSEYIRILEVLAVPDTPINITARLQILDLGCFKMASNRMLALKESRVGIKVCEN